MDREIPKEERRRAAIRRWLRYGVVTVAVAVVVVVVIRMAGNSGDARGTELSVVDRGDLQISVSAGGSVVPERQEVVVSPINTRIVETYKKAGDVVDSGVPLLRLDLLTAETDYRKGLDDEQMRRLQLEKLRVNQNTQLTDMKMKIEIARMALDSKRMQLRNERYLDSIGSGTTDRVRQAELDYNTAALELEQLRKQYENGQRAAEAERRVQELDLQMFRKSLAETKRTLEDAKVRSPRKAVLTYINNNIGAQVAQGEQIATVSDLSSFKVDCTIADGYNDRMAVGGRVMIRTGKTRLYGVISTINPQTKNGMMDFTVSMDNPSDKALRPGLKVDVFVLTSEKSDVMRIRTGPFYHGPGNYRLRVKEGDRLVERNVSLGEAGYEYVEVLGGLRLGEEVEVKREKE